MNNYAERHSNDKIAIRFDGVSFSYGEAQVLENASFHIHKGEFVGMVGPNGAGKTTVLKLLLGLEKPDAGNITLFGFPMAKAADNFRSRIGFVPQQLPADQAFPITVRDLVRMGLLRPLKGYNRGNFALPFDRARQGDAVDNKNAFGEKDAVVKAMELAGITDLSQQRYGSLSGGQKRRALVARALVCQPDILILDEPTANMDQVSETRLFETLGALKGATTILIVTHDSGFVSSLTDRVLCLGGSGKGIVQHRTEAVDTKGHSGASSQIARVLHAENIPADDCCW